MYNTLTHTVTYLLLLFILGSCTGKKADFEVTEFNCLTNKEYKQSDSIVEIEANLTDAALQGIRIPDYNQAEGGKIAFNFKIKRAADSKVEKLYYRLYYQNETYKFDEEHELNGENFYGSWEDTLLTFKEVPDFTNEIVIADSLTIVGNPRNEKMFFAPNPKYEVTDTQLVRNTVNYIKSDEAWYKAIREKAASEKRTVEEQLKLDALWTIKEIQKKEGNINNRMWRNPRMGKYEFMVVVVTESVLKQLPEYAKRLDLLDNKGKFVNPFAFYKTGKASNWDNAVYVMGNKKIKTKARYNLGAGVYVDPKKVGRDTINKENYTPRCGDSYALFTKAHFQQYFHYINRSFPLKNIKETEDVADPSFTRERYDALKKQYEKSQQYVDTYVNSSDCPCKTVTSDSAEKYITLVNPGNKEGEYKKEHVGISGRIGFTYGKWRAKIKFPSLINKHNVWNGLTNAFWLLSQETGAPWNMRRECNADVGYIPKSAPDNEESMKLNHKRDGYSEIDFEILKESQYWPMTSYPGKKNGPKEDAALLDDITVTCTNWDLACQQPENFGIGAKRNTIDDITFVHHRWNYWYKALTTKVPAKNKEVFEADYYYFEIEWQPEKITWRIGPEKDKMRIVCIMDQTVTSVPNNQMVPLVTQEWHNQEWWPMAPFQQNFVPFPKKDIVGKVLEIEVE